MLTTTSPTVMRQAIAALGSVPMTGHDKMHMRMIVQVASPGMQHARNAQLGGTDILWILSELEERCFRGLEDRSVTLAWMRTHERTKLGWHGKGQHKVNAREQLIELLSQPDFSFYSSADRTMPIATRSRYVMILAAVLTLINRTSRLRRSATHDRTHRLDLVLRHLIGILLQVCWSVSPKDIPDLRATSWIGTSGVDVAAHAFLFMIALILAMAASSPTVVRCR